MQAEIQKVRFAGLKASATRVLTHPLVGKSLGALFSDRIPCRGVRVDTRVNVTDEVKAELFWGIYESAEIRFIQRYLRTDLDVVELGSSLGVVASHIAQRIIGRRLICVEANPSLKETIQANLHANARSVDCRVIEAAIDYEATDVGVTSFVRGRNNLDSKAARGEHEKSIWVKSTTLSALLREHTIDEYALVTDIEGAELGIFLADSAALRNCRQIIAELHDATFQQRSADVEDLINIICRDCGFTLRARRGPVCVFDKEPA